MGSLGAVGMGARACFTRCHGGCERAWRHVHLGLWTRRRVLRGLRVRSGPPHEPRGKAARGTFTWRVPWGWTALPGTVGAARGTSQCPLDPKEDICDGMTETAPLHRFPHCGKPPSSPFPVVGEGWDAWILSRRTRVAGGAAVPLQVMAASCGRGDQVDGVPGAGEPHPSPASQGGLIPSCSGAALTPGQAPGREATALVL